MNQIENYEISLDKLTKRVEELRAKEKTLNTQQQALNKAFKEGKITEQQYQKAMAGLNKELSAVANSQKQLGKVIDQQKRTLVDYGKTIGGVGDALGKVGGLGVGGFGAIGNAIKSLVAGPMGALTLAISAIATAWDHFKSKWEKDVEEQGSKLQTQLEQMAAYSDKNLNSQLDLLHKQNEMRKANLKTEVERVKYQQERDEAEVKKMNEIADKLKKQYDLKVNIKDIEEKIAYYQNLADNEKSSAVAKKQYIREVAHLKEIQTYYTKIAALQKDQRTKNMELQLAQQMDAEEERKKAEKEEEERIKKAKEDAKRLAEERRKANEEAIKQLEDLRIKCISDETERQKAQIELDKKRAIEALEKIYAKAGAEGKKAAKEAIKLLNEISQRDLVNVDIKEMQTKFGSYMTKLTDVMKDEMTVSMRRLLSGVDSSTSEESLANLEKHFNTMNASIEATLESYTNLNNKELAGTEEYTRHVENLMRIFRELDEANPMRDLVTAAEARGANKLAIEEFKMQKAIEDINKRILDEKEKLNKLYKDEQDSIVAITTAEVKRMDVAKEQNKAAKYDEFQQRKISYEQMLADVEAIDAEFAEKREILNQKTNEKLKLINDNYAASEVNIRKNAEDEKTLITQEAAERRRQIMADEFNNASQFVGGMSDMFSALGDLQMSIANDETKSDAERDKARRKALNLQIAQTFMSMASGLAQGIASATEAGWPMMLLSIPSTVAMLIAQFAQVKQIMSQKNSGGYATGGEVKGKGSGTSDSIDARLSNGEYVVRNEVAQNNLPLLNSLNFGGGNNNFIEQLATAMAMQPAPQVAVQTIERVQTDLRQTEVYSHM